MKWSWVFLVCLGMTASAQQKLYSKIATISFLSKASFENIESRNQAVYTFWDLSSGQMEFSLNMQDFVFKKSLMKKHFNKNYVESDKFPIALFKGTINIRNIALNRDSVYKVQAAGILTIHGISRQITAPGVIRVINGNVSSSANFYINVEDYKIHIPALYRFNINKKVLISVKVGSYSVYKQDK